MARVVEAAFKQAVARRGGAHRRARALSARPRRRCRRRCATCAQAASRADAIFIPDGADAVPTVVQTLAPSGIDTKRVQLLGTGLWDDAQIFSNPQLDGAWYRRARPDRLSQFLRPLPQPLRPGSGAHRLARL